ncbi:MAG: UDP-N-acetylmuramyl pentapeptide synthase, partial [Pseudohongiella sp.]|nr:UDP-N-acetylmuramyl pentapeptide synthase [Pseudohongiella sp.]
MIGRIALSKLFAYMPAKLIGSDVEFDNVNTDTRTTISGDLFVALVGDHFNGNKFVEIAAQQQAAAAIV